MIPDPDSRHRVSNLTGTRLLARNSAFNLAGFALPVAAALLSIPVIIKGIGTDRFGVLTLIWMVLGYFSLLDLGLGRALTKILAEHLGRGDEEHVPAIIWSALALVTLMGLAAMPVLMLLAPWLVHDVLKIPASLREETILSIHILAWCLPAVLCTGALSGILESVQRFGRLSLCRFASGMFVYLSPLAVLQFSDNLAWMVGTLAAGRVILMLAYLALCYQCFPSLGRAFSIQVRFLKPMLAFGGWLTVSHVVDPLMTFLDRFMIGAMASMTAVAYYATPYETITRMWVIPVAISGVVFPAFSAKMSLDAHSTRVLFDRAVTGVLAPLFLLNLAVVSFAHEGLSLWLGAAFAAESAPVLELLAVGVFVNGVIRIPDALIKAAGRPDLISKYHLSEFAVYVPLVWWLTGQYGIVGTAWAWLLRVCGEAIFIFALSRRYLDRPDAMRRHAAWTTAFALLLLILSFLPCGLGVRLAAFLLAASACSALLYYLYLPAPDRARLLAVFRRTA